MSEALSTFKKRLAGGEYETLTGSRRAIGKMKNMSDDERNTARRAADKYFDGKPAPKANKKAPKKAAKKAPKKAAAKSAHGPGKGRKKKAAVKKPAAAKAAPVKAGKKKASVGVARATKVLNSTDEVMKELKCYEIAVDKLRDISGQVDVTKALEAARDGIHKCVASLQGLKLTVTGGNGVPKPAEAPAQAAAPPAPAPAPAPPGALPGGLPGMPGTPGTV